MKNYILKNKWFIGTYILIILSAISLHFYWGDNNISLYTSGIHTPLFDIIFKYLTYFGEGWFGVPACIYFFYKNKKWGISASVISITSGLITQFNKHFVFENKLRPSLVLKNYALNFVDGVEILQNNSFPSGHTTFAFAIFTFFALIYNKPIQQLFFLMCAIAVALSRIYLLQHFLIDTIVGSLIGIVSAIVFYWFIIEKQTNTK